MPCRRRQAKSPAPSAAKNFGRKCTTARPNTKSAPATNWCSQPPDTANSPLKNWRATKKTVNSKAYRSLPAHTENAHRIAAFAELSGGYSPAAVGWLYFRAANGKYPGEPYSRAELKRLYRKALSHLNKALREPGSPRDKQSARYALAGIYRISGDFARAESVLRTLLQENLEPNDRKDAEYVLESVRLKDSGHILPRFHRPAMP
ncbi:lipopolysaccharide assembly protein LapB [Neisseria sp. KEM232]|uniref:tetratricopeptide repeat protein n=1 Tax=Neisseria sp. KEM232 TaxID=655307 RepID=UPI001E515A07|nr:hypothetical protein [Neisseria sp. KEM232]